MSARKTARQKDGWEMLRCGVRLPNGFEGDQWLHVSGIGVLSAVEHVEQNPPGSGILMPHYHVSARFNDLRDGSGRTVRVCTDQEMEKVRADFGMGGAEEDNHGPGIVRHLWLMVGRDKEPECPCKQDEDRIVEGDRVRYEEPRR